MEEIHVQGVENADGVLDKAGHVNEHACDLLTCMFMHIHARSYRFKKKKDAGSQREPDTNSRDIEHTRTKHYGISIFRYRRR